MGEIRQLIEGHERKYRKVVSRGSNVNINKKQAIWESWTKVFLEVSVVE